MARDLQGLGDVSRLRLVLALLRTRNPDQAALLASMTASQAAPHIDALAASGFVRRQSTVRNGDAVDEVIVQPQRIFQLSEDLARLTEVEEASDLLATRAVAKVNRSTGAILALGPGLIVAHGLRIGKVFPLPDPGPWTLGRDAVQTIALEHDGYASGRHAEIALRAKRHVVIDQGSRNGTFLNWERLAAKAEITLTPGDVLAIGKTLFVYRRPG